MRKHEPQPVTLEQKIWVDHRLAEIGSLLALIAAYSPDTDEVSDVLRLARVVLKRACSLSCQGVKTWQDRSEELWMSLRRDQQNDD